MSRDISLDLSLRAINLYVYSILINGDETWTLYVESIKKLEALEMLIFKHLARVGYKDKVTNEEVLRRLDVERGLPSQIKTHKLSYLATLQDMTACRKQSSQVEYMVEEEGADIGGMMT